MGKLRRSKASWITEQQRRKRLTERMARTLCRLAAGDPEQMHPSTTTTNGVQHFAPEWTKFRGAARKRLIASNWLLEDPA